MFEVFVKGVSFGKASFQECADYADYLVNTARRYDIDDLCIVDCTTGEIVEP